LVYFIRKAPSQELFYFLWNQGLVYYCAGANSIRAGARSILAGANSILAGVNLLLLALRFLVSMKRFLLYLDDFESQVAYLLELD
jgi:hypothetical protein